MKKQSVVIFWFRRDLRWDDNPALLYALKSGLPVIPVFIFDKNLLDTIATKPKDRRVQFIYDRLKIIHTYFQQNFSSGILFFYGKPLDAFKKLLQMYEVKGVYFNRDYEPYAIERDNQIKSFLKSNGIESHTYKDIVIFEPQEVLSTSGKPFTVYSQYAKAWKKLFEALNFNFYPSEKFLHNLFKFKDQPIIIPFEDLGFIYERDFKFPEPNLDEETLTNYHKTRNYPYLERGTTKISLHLRFGTLSIRKIVFLAQKFNATLLNELIWREFYQSILYHFPWTKNQNFNPKFNKIQWNFNEKLFQKWKAGETGFPIIDAGMRELNETGYMHNRVRMIASNFFAKILMFDWRLGEAYFREKLLDYEAASNLGNWQWSAGTGVDAAPYFRIFNPELQQKKFDPDFKYIKKWIPDFNENNYIPRIVNYEEQREKYLMLMKTLF